jgi:hypothetical protein
LHNFLVTKDSPGPSYMHKIKGRQDSKGPHKPVLAPLVHFVGVTGKEKKVKPEVPAEVGPPFVYILSHLILTVDQKFLKFDF